MTYLIRNELFEWLLAGWAGYGENPAEIFPHLGRIDPGQWEREMARLCPRQASDGDVGTPPMSS